MDPSGNAMGSGALMCDNIGRRDLPATGTYTIVVGGSSATGTYGFTLLSVPPDTTFPITIGTTVKPSMPPGAGNISVPGQRQIYGFNANAGQAVFLKSNTTTCNSIVWRLLDPGRNELASFRLFCNDLGRQQLPVTGKYSMIVQGGGTNGTFSETGTYSFSLTATS
jgi:hypothetical protein